MLPGYVSWDFFTLSDSSERDLYWSCVISSLRGGTSQTSGRDLVIPSPDWSTSASEDEGRGGRGNGGGVKLSS